MRASALFSASIACALALPGCSSDGSARTPTKAIPGPPPLEP